MSGSAGAAGSGPAGAGGSGTSVGGSGPAGAGGSLGSAGKGGSAGVGGSLGSAGSGGSGFCGNGIVEGSEQCDGRDLRGETCGTATMGARPNGFLTCSPGCTFDTSGCSFAGTGGTGGGPGVGGSGGIAGGGGGGPTGPSAFWMFDDCSAVTRTLLDSSGNGIHAQRTVSAACVPGIQGQAVEFNEAGDRVEALNAPQFALDQRVAVAAWVNPTRTDDSRPIVLKRLNNKTAFSLRIQKGQAQFEIVLDNGKSTVSSAPIVANTWSHVAGMFDGRFVFLFINGEQVGQIFAEGSIRDVDAPLRIGATTQQQRFDGRIDNVWISTNPVSAADIQALSCIRQPSTLMVSPLSSGPVPAGTAFTYDVDVRNNDIGMCAPRSYQVNTFSPTQGISVFAQPPFIPGVRSGQTANFDLVVRSDESVEPGVFNIPFFVVDFSVFFEQLFGSVQYEVAEPTGCHVKTPRELMIRNPGVVDDFLRTSFDGPPEDPRTAAWTFGRLMEQAAPSPEQATDMVERVFNSWLTDQTINTFSVFARPEITPTVLDFWPRRSDGRIDLHRAPLRLLAIVNRFDLRNLDQGHAGEGRFVFGVLGPFGEPLEFTVILEYMLPAATEAEVLEWAQGFHALSQHPFPSEEYNAALQALTDRFTARGAGSGRPNGSALLTLRTNEIALESPWQLREFRLGADGFLEPVTVKLTPDAIFNGTQTLADFINANEAAVIAEHHVVPDIFQDQPFLGGAIFNNFDVWFAFGTRNNEARHKFSLNTCNGCHGGETQTSFLHVSPRFPGSEAQLSGFLTGIDVFDPVSGQLRRLNDLGRRNADLKAIVCPAEPLSGATADGLKTATPTSTSLRVGIGRVH